MGIRDRRYEVVDSLTAVPGDGDSVLSNVYQIELDGPRKLIAWFRSRQLAEEYADWKQSQVK